MVTPGRSDGGGDTVREPTTKSGRGLVLDAPEHIEYILAIEDEAKAQERERLGALVRRYANEALWRAVTGIKP